MATIIRNQSDGTFSIEQLTEEQAMLMLMAIQDPEFRISLETAVAEEEFDAGWEDELSQLLRDLPDAEDFGFENDIDKCR